MTAGDRLKRLARRILADALSVGSAATAGPTVGAEQEAGFLDAIELRLRDLLERHGHESDEEVVGRFRVAHPDLARIHPPAGGGRTRPDTEEGGR